MIVLVFIALTVLSLAVNWTLLKKVKQLGTQAYRAQVRWSAQAKPTIGGVSFLVGFLAALGWLGLSDYGTPTPDFHIGVFALAALVAFGMGLADDIWQTRPGSKFFFQILCGILLVFAGGSFDFGVHPAVQAVMTIIWVVALMNSVNMLDNMDGVSGGAALAVFLGLWLLDSDGVVGLLALGMAATLLGFLILNWHPSKLFMGDAGSQLLGFLLAALSIIAFRFEGQHTLVIGNDVRWLLLPLLFFTTLCDTGLVTLNRILNGRSPFVGGRDHSTHNLSYLGWSDGGIGIFYVLWSAFNAGVVYYLLYFPVKNVVGILLGTASYMLVVFITFYLISRWNIERDKYSYTS